MINFFKDKNRRKYIFVAVSIAAVFVLISVFFPEVVSAQDEGKPGYIERFVSWVLGWVIYMIASAIGILTTFLIGWLVQVAQWDNFTNVVAVDTGWKIVRDLSNMFFILILLIISFSVILRRENYSIQQMLPRVIVMAILINFSKTICEIFVEFSQVVMMTFVNAFAENGEASIVSLIGMDKMWQFARGDESGELDLTIVAALLIGLIATLVTLVVIVTAMAVFVMRIVLIWINIVLSPLAFLLSSFPGGKNYANEWVGDFTKNLVSGPVLAFFMWLALKTSSESVEALTVTDISRTMGGATTPNSFLGPEVFVSYLITIGFLIGGLITTARVGGVAGSAASKGMGYIQKGRDVATKRIKSGTKKASISSAKAVGRGGLGAAGLALTRTPLSKNDSLNKAGKMMTNWRTDLQNSRYDEKKKKRLKRLEKIGMGGEGTQKKLAEFRDSELGKKISRGKNVAVGVAAGVGTAGIYNAVKAFSNYSDRKELEKHNEDSKEYNKKKEVYDEQKSIATSAKDIDIKRNNEKMKAEIERLDKSDHGKFVVQRKAIQESFSEANRIIMNKYNEEIKEINKQMKEDLGKEPKVSDRIKYQGSVTKGALAQAESNRKKKAEQGKIKKAIGEDNFKDMAGDLGMEEKKDK